MYHITIRTLSHSSSSRILRPPNPRTRLKSLQICTWRQYAAQASKAPFTYRISASFSAKQHALDLVHNQYFHDSRETYLKCSNDELSKVASSKRWKSRYSSGQDSFFVANSKDAIAFGVVDGVGGWTEQGVDPAEFAHRLCEYMSTEASLRKSDGAKAASTGVSPQSLLQRGYDQLMADNSVEAGGSTACIGTVTSSGMLHVANLGDSGYVHISPLRLTHLSSPQTHTFNTPYQLAKIPEEEAQQIALFGSAHFQEHPDDADAYSHPVSHGDVFVFATDGVWDNLSPEDILRIVSGVMLRIEAWVLDGNGAVQVGRRFSGDVDSNLVFQSATSKTVDLSTLLASAVVKEAKECSVNRRRDGPFAKEVKRHFPFENWRGGKPDDICVIVGLVHQHGA